MTVLITGGSRGLGDALCKNFLQKGQNQKIVNISRNSSTQKEVINLSLDLSSLEKESFSSVLDHGPYEWVFFNAGLNRSNRFDGTNNKDIEQMININFSSVIELTQYLLNNQLLAPRARLVYISSLSHQLSYPYSAVYAASKEGVTHFVRSLRMTEQDYHFHLVFPGPLDTDMARENSNRGDDSASRLDITKASREIMTKCERGVLEVYPGYNAKIFNMMSKVSPSLMSKLMKVIMEKSEKN